MPVIGVRAHDYPHRQAEPLCAAIAEAGFQTMQLAVPKSFGLCYPLNGQACDETKRALAANGLTISVLGCYVDLAAPDRAARQTAVSTFIAGLQTGRDLGAGCVGTETTGFKGTPAQRDEAFEWLVESLLPIAEAAEKLGVDIGVEPVFEHVLNTPERALELKRRVDSPRLKWIWDPVNLLNPGIACPQTQFLAACAAALEQDIVAMHVKDTLYKHGEGKRGVPLFEGDMDWPWIFHWAAGRGDLPLLREEALPHRARDEIARIKGYLQT